MASKDDNANESVLPITPCAEHGSQLKRSSCKECNASYVRSYLKRKRRNEPVWAILKRAKDRAKLQNVKFYLAPADVSIPDRCPVLGIPLRAGGRRHEGSPSLDRIDPHGDYIVGNVRVISDRANRLKGAHSLLTLKRLSEVGRFEHRETFLRLAAYVEREMLLYQVRRRAALGGRAGEEWNKIADFLDRIFCSGERLSMPNTVP